MQKEHFETVIAQMGPTFDSHAFIERFMSMYESVYVGRLSGYSEAKASFRTLHAQIGRYLALHADELGIRPSGPVPSENIKGNETYCQKWEKL